MCNNECVTALMTVLAIKEFPFTIIIILHWFQREENRIVVIYFPPDGATYSLPDQTIA